MAVRTKKDIDNDINIMRRLLKECSADKQKAFNLLYNANIINAKGQLREGYR